MLGHPKGLSILFFTEMWERFSYYGMKTILVLFLVSTTNGGFGWENGRALTLLGLYTMMVYVMSVPGGILADRILGQKRAVMIGGALLCAGHLLMAWPAHWAFYTALVLLVCGVGLLKPNISTMVGNLYQKDDPKMEEGFTIFYMGINLGSFIATLVVSYVGEVIGWHIGFSLAGFGMLLGQAVFMYGQKHLKGNGDLPVKEELGRERVPLTKIEKDRLLVISLCLVVIASFWIAFEQAPGLLTLYAKEYTNRVLLGFEIPSSMFLSLNAGFILILGGLVARFWQRQARLGKVSNSVFKMGVGNMILGFGYLFMVCASLERTGAADGKSSMIWLVGIYFLHTVGELCLSPVALSFITKLAPKRMMASVMGVFWAVTGLSSFAAALVGKWANQMGELGVFIGLAVVTVVLGGALVAFSQRINQLTHGADAVTERANDDEAVIPARALEA